MEDILVLVVGQDLAELSGINSLTMALVSSRILTKSSEYREPCGSLLFYEFKKDLYTMQKGL